LNHEIYINIKKYYIGFHDMILIIYLSLYKTGKTDV
jgi:hypothetical protein